MFLKKNAFYGSVARTVLLKCTNVTKVTRFKNDANNFCEKAIQYLRERFDFKSNKFQLL